MAAPNSVDATVSIADHGLIGDLRTAALITTDGTVDWFCAPRFDSPSVFAALLDQEQGGAWQLAPVDVEVRSHQFYFPDSNILITRFNTEQGVVEVHDFMPLVKAHDPGHRQRLVRRVVGIRGDLTMRMRMIARPNYGLEHPELSVVGGGVVLSSDSLRLGLSATAELDTADGEVSATFKLFGGDSALFVLEVLEADQPYEPAAQPDTEGLFDQTAAFWRTWLAQSAYTGRWREMVNRSALTLKLLCHEPSGAIVAAVTTSLPETLGGERNWDYRYVWVRDAAFSLYALLRLGFTDEAASFMRWLSERLGDTKISGSTELGPLRVLYDLDGNVPDNERTLNHLRGYADSRPVRVGNTAGGQLQLDIYGELIDSVYLFNKYGPGISYDAWKDLVSLIDWLADNWDRADAGMWETRAGAQKHTTSRLMAWVALERMIRVARQRGLPGNLTSWAKTRDEIYLCVMEHGWNDEIASFVQAEGSDAVDAGLLLLPMVKFVAPNDTRFLATLKRIEQRLVSDSLVFRYDPDKSPDGVDGTEGTFSLCSFWYVEALTRVGRLDDARLALEKMFTYANHLGLYAEQIGLTGDQLGNFPQAFTHLALISAATNLDQRLG